MEKTLILIEQSLLSGHVPHDEAYNTSKDIEKLKETKTNLEYENPSSTFYIWDRKNKIRIS